VRCPRGQILCRQILRREMLRLAAAAVALPVASRFAAAQAYPSRPIHLLVPFPAGGTIDLVARLIGQWLTDRLGAQVVIENKPGGGTNIAVQAAVSAPPDGYTLLVILATNTINPSLYKKLPFDFQRDIAPVAGLAELPLVMEVNPGVPAKTVLEFVDYAKANPGKINFASFGTHTISDLAIDLFSRSTGVSVVRVPYQGGAPMMTDLLTGRVQAGVDALPNSLPHIKAGGVRALAMLSRSRSPALLDVPAIGEAIPGFEVSAWSGIGVPSGTPSEIVERLNREINAGLADPGIQARLAEVGGTPLPYTPTALRAMIARDVEKWAKVVTEAGIEPE
jgi:tripartite-type tricarboxylate transporter receptor subunit TctC